MRRNPPAGIGDPGRLPDAQTHHTAAAARAAPAGTVSGTPARDLDRVANDEEAMSDEALIIRAVSEASKTIEICRSFSYKLNLENHGGRKYESADFFASRKMTCSVEDQGWVSQQIFEECVAEVRAAAAAFIESVKQRKERKPVAGNARELEQWRKEAAI